MSVLRVIDANANRAREALRVMEEAARFLLGDAALTESIKDLRHEIAATMTAVTGLDRDRDVKSDVGTAIGGPGERTRDSAAAVAARAGCRLGEALRSIEEFAKTFDPELAARAEAFRYAGYDLEHRLNRAFGARGRRQWRVCVLLTESACAKEWRRTAEAVAAAEPDAIQVREKGAGDGALLARVRQVVEMARPGTAVIVNDRPDVALLAGAHGVHVGQGDLPCAAVRRLVGRDLLVGVSTSRLAEAEQALADGADYCGVGPMFPSATKARETIAGPAYLRAYRAWDRLPHLAIGGITPANLPVLLEAGARGVAVSAAVCGAEDPGAVVRSLRAALGDEDAAAPVGAAARERC